MRRIALPLCVLSVVMLHPLAADETVPASADAEGTFAAGIDTPCTAPLELEHIDDLRIAVPRSEPDGFAYFFGAASDPMGEAIAYIYDSDNEYVEVDAIEAQAIGVQILRDGATITVEAGDYITLTRDDSTTVRVYFPALGTDDDVTLYIGLDGSTYWDRDLCDLAQAAPLAP